ncbi:MAG: hypothetical protein J5717_13985 [Lachnospiraceae bacterium]|nr:hypothetical protein [Lachnospiraceae bacterium]MBO4618446.1 hypothetical protein [Lachnospiraceae bacterium]
MWTEYVDNTYFIREMYNEAPKLNNVVIEKMDIINYGREVRLYLKIEDIIDNIPAKWKKMGYDAVIIEIAFYDVCELDMRTDYARTSTISIDKLNNDSIRIAITGGINAMFSASAAYMQKAEGYKK